MSAAKHEYALGRSAHEYGRLTRQAELLKPMTLRLFQEAGITDGMRVLDLGSGSGDVCTLLAEMVGPQGKVIGLDLDANAVQHAMERVAAAGHSNIEFVHSDLTEYTPEAPFDAVVGRLVLLYQADPAEALKALVKHLSPGGIVAFMEPWFMPPMGPHTVTKRMATCIVETLRRSGAHLDLGPRMHSVFTAAGLPAPVMRFEAAMDGREDSPIFQYCADTLASALPKAIEYGITTEGEFDIENLPQQLLAERTASGYAMLTAPMVTAWCRL